MCTTAKSIDTEATIISISTCGKDQIDLVIETGTDLSSVQPGRCFMLHPGEPFFLSRPFSVAGVDRAKNTLSFLIKVLGAGTDQLSKLSAGDTVRLNGPFGNTFNLDAPSPHLLLGGGIGIAPIMFLADELKKRDIPFDIFYGARSEEDLAYKDFLTETFGDSITFATDDGSTGFHGNALAGALALEKEFKSIHACGPTPLLKACVTAFESQKENLWLSLEERMACGFGACNGCAVEATEKACKESPRVGGGKYLKVCADGPVFRADQLAWSE